MNKAFFRIPAICILSLLSFRSFAADGNAHSSTDTLIKNGFLLELSPFAVELRQQRAGMIGFSGKLNYRWNKWLFAGEYRRAYGNPNNLPYFFAYSGNEFEGVPLTAAEFSVTYFFLSVTHQEKMRNLGIRGGFIKERSSWSDLHIHADEVNGDQSFSTTTDISSVKVLELFTGIQFTAAKVRRKQSAQMVVRNFYLDYLYNLQTDMYNIFTRSGAPVQIPGDDIKEYKLTPAEPWHNGGIRLGIHTRCTGRILDPGYGIELNNVPGNKSFGNNIGFNLKFTLSVHKPQPR